MSYSFKLFFILILPSFWGCAQGSTAQTSLEKWHQKAQLAYPDSEKGQFVFQLHAVMENFESSEQWVGRTLYDLMNKNNYRSLETSWVTVVRLDSTANIEQIIYSENCPEEYKKSFETLLNQSFEYLQFNKNLNWQKLFGRKQLLFETTIKWYYAGGAVIEHASSDAIASFKTSFLSSKETIVMPLFSKEM
ncbi:hypothetical protein [Flectobacillus sp. BAB-3569]|uniref:hypothetical protein n=1 Tax=Flectobacillus sp. BAB-3569 TaxID=1509483 RepID=UPI000BA48038|nr:hypothetical protein [Flectobacillus sp. BAB-3569]PAC28683.1 hypothetical protein BWI92_19065 [Flectobacillus sp. BAB-3569]